MEEQLIGILPADINEVWRIGYYNLYITNKRIIAGKTGSGQIARSVNKGTFGAFVLGGALVGSIAYKLQKEKKGIEIKSDDESKYKGMGLEEILTSDKNNFEYNLNCVKSIELKKPSNFRGGKHMFNMIITAVNKKTFICDPSHFDHLHALLKEMVPDKVKSV